MITGDVRRQRLVADFIARAIVPGKDDIGLWRTIVLWIGSIIGAVIVLVVDNKVTGRRRIGR